MNLILHETKNPFKNLSTEKLRFNVYQKECDLLRPIKFWIGNRTSSKKSKVEESVFAVNLPLHRQFESLLKLPGILNAILQYHAFLSNVIQASLWTRKYKTPYENRIVLPVNEFLTM